jgi:pre-rRNA-processing protein TSR3
MHPLNPSGSLRFLVLLDHKENRRKCTLTPLEGREGFTFVRLEPDETFTLDSGLILDVEGTPLRPEDREFAATAPIVLVDGTWARVPKAFGRLRIPPGARVARRSIRGIATAYPRASKLRADPPAGLASVEALYAASAILGEPRPDLLRDYHWAREFLARNWGG